MGLSQAAQQAVARAKQRVSESANVIEREYFGETFEFRFLPTISQPALEIVSRVQELGDSDRTLADRLHLLLGFMDAMATDETAELIAELARAGVMTINDLVEVQQEIVTLVSARPTTRSSSSEPGSQSPGPTSTASAPSEA